MWCSILENLGKPSTVRKQKKLTLRFADLARIDYQHGRSGLTDAVEVPGLRDPCSFAVSKEASTEHLGKQAFQVV